MCFLGNAQNCIQGYKAHKKWLSVLRILPWTAKLELRLEIMFMQSQPTAVVEVAEAIFVSPEVRDQITE